MPMGTFTVRPIMAVLRIWVPCLCWTRPGKKPFFITLLVVQVEHIRGRVFCGTPPVICMALPLKEGGQGVAAEVAAPYLCFIRSCRTRDSSQTIICQISARQYKPRHP